MLKSKLNVLTLKKEPIPAVLFHEPEAIELCTTTPLMKARTHSGCKVAQRENSRASTRSVFVFHFSHSKACLLWDCLVIIS
ncbi:RIKEN cDNA 5033414K04, isoform CRA_d [Mus musculus]|uniref:Phosphotyrosine interaction domain containing 1 n=1 Tax=Mus musculus TaxID=10090 RepID=H3BKK5_MOUSE|nr:RIKEN cDNA 5033414K04, isoform CRA_d [Mus musculus]